MRVTRMPAVLVSPVLMRTMVAVRLRTSRAAALAMNVGMAVHLRYCTRLFDPRSAYPVSRFLCAMAGPYYAV
jgi:hypothetical protein